MNINKFKDAIDFALLEADNFVNKYYGGDNAPMVNTKKALLLLKHEIENNGETINERVLRAMHDIGATSVKSYENTPLEEAIDRVINILYNDIPMYRYLEPLRLEFGKGDPI